jgi:clan AA aspartic protease (TIGR02281 family)
MPRRLILFFVLPLVSLSTAALAQNANGVARTFGAVSQELQSQSVQQSPYVVDGLRLGGHVRLDSDAYRQYNCNPSGKFTGFTWCHKDKAERTGDGEVTSSNSILHAPDGTAWYINRYIEPAFFESNEVQNEIERLSAKFGSPTRILRLPLRLGLPDAVIAVWGKIELNELDASEAATVASGGSVRGLLISYLGDLQRSAKANVPVYRLDGGAGSGQGALRFLTIDASQIAAPNVETTYTPLQTALPSPPRASTLPNEVQEVRPILGERFSVAMKLDGGVYAVPALINDAITLDFVVDSGASDVSIPADVVMTLSRAGTIGPSDFVGQQTHVLADGSEVPSDVFILRSLKVGTHVVQNVKASMASPKATLLLGQSFLQQFHSWSIDNARHALVLE